MSERPDMIQPHGLGAAGLLVVATMCALLLVGCGLNARQPSGPGTEKIRLESQHLEAPDGYRLPLHHWPAEGLSRQEQRRAIVLAVHGFNDHGGSFQLLAEALTPGGIEVYAHDQRGFGRTRPLGIWPGHERLVEDVQRVTERLAKRHPDTPLYLIGESMGAAVVMLARTEGTHPQVAGSVLIAPAVWGLDVMPWYQRLGLWLGVRLAPGLSLSSKAAHRLGIEPTDDPEIKRQLAEDPLILGHARIDTLHGVSRTMDLALEAASELPGPALLLYGGEDHIIPPQALCALLDHLPDPDAVDWRMVFYPEGYHMLTRYTGREQTQADIAAWLRDAGASLPSGHEVDFPAARQALCD